MNIYGALGMGESAKSQLLAQGTEQHLVRTLSGLIGYFHVQPFFAEKRVIGLLLKDRSLGVEHSAWRKGATLIKGGFRQFELAKTLWS